MTPAGERIAARFPRRLSLILALSDHGMSLNIYLKTALPALYVSYRKSFNVDGNGPAKKSTMITMTFAIKSQ